MSDKPTFFFGVGAQKAGTTWLHRYLSKHPDVHFRSIKELRYFGPETHAQFKRQAKRLREKMNQKGGRKIAASEAEHLVKRNRMTTDCAEFLELIASNEIDVANYREYLLKGRGNLQLVGEITPNYALLSQEKLKQIASVGDDVRIIYLIRDQVARLWSNIRMIHNRNKPSNLADLCTNGLKHILAGEISKSEGRMFARSDYTMTIANMRQVFAPSKFKVLFFETLMRDEGAAEVTDFLGISRRNGDYAEVNVGEKVSYPEVLRGPALKFLRSQYEYVAENFPDLPAVWQKNLMESQQ